MQDMRIQLEALHPTELTEQKSAWFTLPIYEDELSETLGIEIGRASCRERVCAYV